MHGMNSVIVSGLVTRKHPLTTSCLPSAGANLFMVALVFKGLHKVYCPSILKPFVLPFLLRSPPR